MPQNKILIDKRRSGIFINIIVCCAAGAMLTSVLNTALYPIMAEFSVSATTGQWLTSGYTLTMAIIMPLTAFLINRFPTKRLYCASIAILIVGLILSAAAVNFSMMMIGRVIQAAGTGMWYRSEDAELITIVADGALALD